MKRKISVLLIVAMLVSVLTLPSVNAEDTLFYDDFENGFSYWQIGADSDYSIRKVDSMQLVYYADGLSGAEKLISQTMLSSAFDLEFDLLSPKGNYFGLYLGYTDNNNYHLIKWDIKSSDLEVVRKKNGGMEELVDFVPCKLDSKTNKIAISAEAGICTVTVNDIAVTDFDIKANGYMGFYGENSSFRVDNVSAEGKTVTETEVSNDRLSLAGTISGMVDGSTTKADFESRVSKLPEEIKLAEPVAIEGEVEIFVSPNGSDNNNGTIDKPFETFDRAVKEINILNSGTVKPKGIVLYLREGDYVISETLNFDKNFSGTSEHPLIISSYNGEKVSFLSGLKIKQEEFSPVTDGEVLKRLKPSAKDKIVGVSLKKDLPTGYSRIHDVALYANGVPMTMARYPNTTEVQMGNIIRGGNKSGVGTVVMKDMPEGVVYEMFDTAPMGWKDTGEILWNGCFSATWDIYRTLVKKIDHANGTIETSGQSWADPAVSSPHFTHYYENVLEEMDMPGEWCVDGESMMLYMYPYQTGIDYEYSFVHSTKDLLNFNNVSNLVLNGITVEHSGGKGIIFKNCNNCIVQNSKIMNTKQQGIQFLNTTQSGVMDSYLYNIGFDDTNGIDFTLEGSTYEDDSYSKMVAQYDWLTNYKPSGNFCQNNFVSCPFGTHRPVQSSGYVQTIISHNTFSNCYRYAINCSFSPESILEYNEAVTTPFEINDAGTIYATATGLPTAVHVRYNYFHDPVEGGNVIYFDEGTSGSFAYGNVGVDYAWCGVASNGGRDIAAFNNIFINKENNKYGGWRYSGIGGSTSYYDKGGGSEIQWMTKLGGNDNTRAIFMSKSSAIRSKVWQDRFPRYIAYLDDQVAAMKERQAGGDRGPKELEARAPGGFYVENNIVVGDGASYGLDDVEGGEPHIFENNYATLHREEVGFVDVENHDFTLREDSPVWEQVPGFKQLDVSKTGLVQTDTRWVKLPEVEKPGYILPLDGSKGEVYHGNVEFVWTKQAVADNFKLIIAKDKDFKDIIETYETPKNSYVTSLPDYGTTYYWKVEAVSKLQSLKAEKKSSDVFSFTTMTIEEAKANIELNTMNIDSLMITMNKKYNSIVEDSAPGNYKPGAKAMLKNVIDNAVSELENCITQNDVDELHKKVSNEWMEFQKFGVPQYVYITKDDFIPSNLSCSNPGAVEFDGDEVIFDAQVGGTLTFKRETGASDVLCFRLKMDDFRNWMCITPAYTPTKQPRYWIIWKPEQIELQYNDIGLVTQTFLKTVDVSHINFGDWVDVELGTVATEQGVWTTIKLNGETVMDFLDTQTPIYSIGNLQFQTNGTNGKIHILPTENKHQSQPVPSVIPGVPDMAVEYGN